MSIHVNQKRKQYFICYKATLDDGIQKTITITNAKWKTNLVGKKYMEGIEQEEIEKVRNIIPNAKGKYWGDVLAQTKSDSRRNRF